MTKMPDSPYELDELISDSLCTEFNLSPFFRFRGITVLFILVKSFV